MQSSESREKVAALGALNQAWWDVLFVRRVRVVWESNFGTSFVLGAPGARNGKWKELARIDWMRGTVKDDKQNTANISTQDLFIRSSTLESRPPDLSPP